MVEEIQQIDPSLPFLEGLTWHKARGRPRRFQLYRLRPLDFSAAAWRISSYGGELYAKAKSPGQARALAVCSYDDLKNKGPHPWWDPRLVAAEVVETAPPSAVVLAPANKPSRG